MEHILITGISGYFGQKLVKLFHDRPGVKRITGIDIRPPRCESGKLEFIECDVRGPLDAVFEGRGIDCVIHTAYILPPIPDVALMEDIYVNGTNNLENVRLPDATWKVRLIEEDFFRLMFEMEGV